MAKLLGELFRYAKGKRFFIGDTCLETYPCQHKIHIISSYYGFPYRVETKYIAGHKVWNEIKKNLDMYDSEDIEHFNSYESID